MFRDILQRCMRGVNIEGGGGGGGFGLFHKDMGGRALTSHILGGEGAPAPPTTPLYL